MPAYIVAEIEVQDPQTFEEYRRLAAASIAVHGGRYVVRGGPVETLEGSWTPQRIVILEFPSTEHARSWWNSADYREAKALRQTCSHAEFLLVQGV